MSKVETNLNAPRTPCCNSHFIAMRNETGKLFTHCECKQCGKKFDMNLIPLEDGKNTVQKS